MKKYAHAYIKIHFFLQQTNHNEGVKKMTVEIINLKVGLTITS